MQFILKDVTDWRIDKAMLVTGDALPEECDYIEIIDWGDNEFRVDNVRRCIFKCKSTGEATLVYIVEVSANCESSQP